MTYNFLICISFRFKVAIAAKRGAKGVILFGDPQDKARDGRNFTFPDSWWLPGMGVESGSLFVVDGDPLTPSYPAIGNKCSISSLSNNDSNLFHN